MNLLHTDTDSDTVDRSSGEAELTEAAIQQFVSATSSLETTVLTSPPAQLVELGSVILDRAPGPHLTFIDPRLHNNSQEIVQKTRQLVSRFNDSGIHKDRIAVSIPATENGILAAKELEVDGIHTNLILISSLTHATFCAEAGASALTFSVGTLLDSYEQKRQRLYRKISSHPGIETIQSTAAYFQLHGIKTKLVGTDFRGVSLTTSRVIPTCSSNIVEGNNAASWLRCRCPIPGTDRSMQVEQVTSLCIAP